MSIEKIKIEEYRLKEQKKEITATNLCILTISFTLCFINQCLCQNKIIYHSDTMRHNSDILTEQQLHVQYSMDSIWEYYFIKNYYQNGVIKEEHNYDGNFRKQGAGIKYYPNGKPKEFAQYVDGSKVGIYLEFFENGQKKTYGEFALPPSTPSFKIVIDTLHDLGEFYDHIVVNEVYNDIKNGRWVHWDTTGKITKTEMWRNGKIFKVE